MRCVSLKNFLILNCHTIVISEEIWKSLSKSKRLKNMIIIKLVEIYFWINVEFYSGFPTFCHTLSSKRGSIKIKWRSREDPIK